MRVYGVEPEKANAMSLALAAGEVVRIQPTSVADGLGAPFAGTWTLAMTRRYVDDVILIDDATILGGLRFALERTKQVVEPAGAAALAALLYGRIPLRNGDRVCAVLSGGNVEVGRLGELIEAAAPLDVPVNPEERNFVASIVPITSSAFAPFGEVVPPLPKASREDLIAAWTAWAEKSYGAPVSPRSIAVKAAGPALPLIEVHTNSPQLTVSFDSPWVLAVLPDGITSKNFDARKNCTRSSCRH